MKLKRIMIVICLILSVMFLGGGATLLGISFQNQNSEEQQETTHPSLDTNASEMTVTYDANGGSIISGSGTQSVTADNTTRTLLSFPRVSRSGYSFKGWKLNSGTYPIIAASIINNGMTVAGYVIFGVYPNAKLEISTSINFSLSVSVATYAEKTKFAFAVTGAPPLFSALDSFTINENQSLYEYQVPSNCYSICGSQQIRDGGRQGIARISSISQIWSTSEMQPSGLYACSADTFVAQWEPNTYNITYKPNGGLPSTEYTQSVKFGESFKTKDASTYSKQDCSLSAWSTSSSSVTGKYTKTNTEYTYDTIGNTTLYATWTVNSFNFKIDGLLDGVSSDSVRPYATFDLYLGGNLVRAGITDWTGSVGYNLAYEIRNIQVQTDKEYLGIAEDSAPISGNVTGETIVILSFRTKTWRDYEAESYASGSGTALSPYIIKTAEQLAKLAVDSISDNLSNKHYKLAADIDLSAHVWSSISVTGKRFNGTFDGALHTISNMYTSKDQYVEYNSGLFATTADNSVIKNIIVKDGTVYGTGDSGALVGNGFGLVQNVIVDNVNVTSVTDAAGGIAGTHRGQLTNCVIRNLSVQGAWYAAGLVAYGKSPSMSGGIKDCSVVDVTVKGGTRGAGILITTDCEGTITGSYGVGVVNGTASKLMYGDSSAWGNWTCNAALNDGYPVQKTLFHIGGMSGSENVYNYLKNTLGFSAA